MITNPRYFFLAEDQENATTSFVDSTDLRFTVAAGRLYSFRAVLFGEYLTSPAFEYQFSVPAGVQMLAQSQPDGNILYDASTPLTLTAFAPAPGAVYTFNGVIDATAAGGEIVLQFNGAVSGHQTVKAGSFIEVFDYTPGVALPDPPFSGSGYPNARALIAAIIEGVSITEPLATGIAHCYEFRPDGGTGLAEFPNVMITGYQMRYLRGASKRERIYTIGLRVAARPVEGSSVAIQDILDALKEAISAAFDLHVTLGQFGSYCVVEGPNWIDKEPQVDTGTYWEDGELLLTIKDAAEFAG